MTRKRRSRKLDWHAPVFCGLLLLLSGCATLPTLDRSMYPEVFEPLDQTDRLLEQARGAGKDKACPVAYNGVLKIRKEAEATYWTCQTAKAAEMARMALEKAKGLCPDTDKDGVPDYRDKCSDTPKGVAVDGNGCPLDTDKDGVPDYRDKCSDTPKGAAVDENGCPLDTDKDGVPDYRDKCSDTPKGVAVDGNGCPLDTDKDGVPDYRDKCPDTPKGVAVDKATGCPLDSDGDGVVDARDQCPGTPKSAKVDAKGCWAVKHILFDIDKTEIKPWSAVELDAVVKVLRANPDLRMELKGHTDNEGRAAYNQTLSENRAKNVRNYMTLQGIPSGRFSISGYGFSRPVADNATPEGRSLNRRVELTPAR